MCYKRDLELEKVYLLIDCQCVEIKKSPFGAFGKKSGRIALTVFNQYWYLGSKN